MLRINLEKGGSLNHIGILEPDTYMRIINRVGVPVALIYFFSMLIYPWFDGGGDWTHVQKVWSRWQGLNVGVLAFASSIIAFNITRYNANKQRERNFLAAKAFLPAALSELCSYFKLSASILVDAWEKEPSEKLFAKYPELPKGYEEIFSKCIMYAEPDVGDYLAKILVWLQVHDARIKDFIDNYNDSSDISPNKYNTITYLYRLGQLQGLVNKLFPFSRSMKKFDNSPLEWDDYENAYGVLNIWIEEIAIDEKMNLEDFTKRAISRDNDENT